MLSAKIVNGSEFVVFDMEWNQPMPGKEYSFDVSELTGEILEIGAVKYIYENGMLIKKGVFSENIRPRVYTKLHYHVRKVTHKTNKDLANGISFKDAYDKFCEFMGKDAILVGWGNSDPHMLKQNLKFFNYDNNLNRYFLDLQPIFSLFGNQMGKQRSVEFAVDYYEIEKEDTFHSATADAIYTGKIFEKIFEHNKPTAVVSAISSSSINPDIQSEFSFVGVICETVAQALDSAKRVTSICPICEKNIEFKIDKFKIRKSEYALLYCNEHGEMFCRTRAKKNKNGKFYSSTIIRFATQNDYYLVAQKREEFEKYGENGKPEPPKEENDTATE